jgi:RNA polymerase sigma-70 factor, ECF subfamily
VPPTEIERLYREHRSRLVRLVERELHDHDDAEDVVQTAFLDAQRALDRGTVPREPRAWLATIALNTAHRLRRRRLNAEPLEEYAAQEAPEVSEIRAALESLPSEQRTAVVYRDVLGFSYGETAEQMRTSVNAVTMLLHRGRKRLRQTLGVTSGGVWLWRWLKRTGMSQVAIAKGAAVVVVGGGLATAGVVAAGRAARAVAPIRTDAVAIAPARHAHLTTAAVRILGSAGTHDSTRPHAKTTDGSGTSAAPGSTQAVSGDSTPAVSTDSTSPPTSLLRLPTIAVSTPQISVLPPTVAATVTVVTPITAATVTIPIGTTATVTTPLTTVTVPVP